MVSDGADILTGLTRLRKHYDSPFAIAAWETCQMRRIASVKFGEQSHEMFFAREALEQASSGPLARYHAQYFIDAGVESIVDACCGVGSDTLAFARAGMRVTSYEIDPVRALFAERNVAVAGYSESVRVCCDDGTRHLTDGDGLWLDPARRNGTRRIVDPDEYLPPVSILKSLPPHELRAIGVKMASAVNHGIAAAHNAALEFVSEDGECKEALLWLNRRSEHDSRVKATIVRTGSSESIYGRPDIEVHDEREISNVGYLYEPDPAVIRAHLVRTLGAKLDASPVDPHIAYLVGNTLSHSSFCASFRVLERFQYSLRRLQTELTARDVGKIIIKKRGFSIEPPKLTRQLKLTGQREMIVVIARVGRAHDVFLCERLDHDVAQ